MSNAGGLELALVAGSSYSAQAELPCRLTDPELFFAESPADVEQAKALCLDCPVRQECLAAALDRREPWGVWGGQLFVNGVVVPRKRPRGRPRKHPVEPVIPAAPAARRSGPGGREVAA
jgi:WhiB family redox-sensing transcriptional regulator